MESTPGESLVVFGAIGVFLLLIFGVGGWVSIRGKRKRREREAAEAAATREAAERLGLTPAGSLPPELVAAGLTLLSSSTAAPAARSILTGGPAGSPTVSFDLDVRVATTADMSKDLAEDVLSMVTGSSSDPSDDDRTTTFRLTCAAAPVDVTCPETIVAPRSRAHLSGRMGLTEARTESGEFDAAYRVVSADPRFASALLQSPLMAWLLDAGRDRAFELSGGWALAYGDRVDPSDRGPLLDALAAFTARLPSVLSEIGDPSLQPKRRRRRAPRSRT